MSDTISLRWSTTSTQSSCSHRHAHATPPHPSSHPSQVKVSRTEQECVLVESSINSCRISIRVKQADDLEALLARKLFRFLAQRADEFQVLRRVPVEGYDISFLITHVHVEEMLKARLVDFILQFMAEVDSELSELKLAVNTRGRLVAAEFLQGFK